MDCINEGKGRRQDAGPLSAAEIDQFITRGYITIKDGIAPVARQEWYEDGLSRVLAAKKTVKKDVIELANTKSVWMKDFAPKTFQAAAQLLGGENRIRPPEIWDDFIFNTRVVDEAEWLPPQKKQHGWHIDGDYFKRFLDSPEQGLLCLILWSGVAEKSGGTFFALDSIKKIAQKMQRHTDGLYPADFGDVYPQCTDFVEVVGNSGDVVLAHPFMLHCGSEKVAESYRLITNPLIALRAPMQFDRSDGNYSPVEKTILNALGVERLDFKRTATAEHFDSLKKARITEGF